MGVGRQAGEDQYGIGPFIVQLTPGFIRQGRARDGAAAGEAERFLDLQEVGGSFPVMTGFER